MIKLVLTDMDNTLLPFGDAQISQDTVCAIHRLLDEGIHFAPATGRGYQDLSAFFKPDPSILTTAIACNALEVWLDNKPVFQKFFSAEDLQIIARCLSDIDDAGLVITADDPRPWIVGLHVKDTSKLDSPGAFPSGYILTDTIPEVQTLNVGVVFDSERIDPQDMQKRLAQVAPTLDFLYTYTDWLDVAPKGWSKADGVPILMDALHITKDELVVFGDGINDLSIMRALPNSVAVANAVPEVAAAARYHIASSSEYAVARACHQIADAAKTGMLPEFMRS